MHCMDMCQSNGFECYGYYPTTNTNTNSKSNPGSPIPPIAVVPVMEQVATVKLHYMSQLLMNGVNVMLMDLDVGFLRDPMGLVDG